MNTRRTVLLTLTAIGVGTAMMACGGDDKNASESSAATVSPTTASSPSPGAATPQSGVIEVEVGEYFFKPPNFEVEKGKPVTFKVRATGTTVHTMTVYKDRERANAVPGADVAVSPQTSGEFTVTFEEPGTLYFFCGIHPDKMKGEITVR